jgi:FdhD protein
VLASGCSDRSPAIKMQPMPRDAGTSPDQPAVDSAELPHHVRGGEAFRPGDIMRGVAAVGPAQSRDAGRPCRGIVVANARPRRIAGGCRPSQRAGQASRGRFGARSAKGGFVVFTNRVSVEMIQKAAAIGVPIVVAISAPTALAVRMAEAAGITLIAVARNDGFEVFTHAERILNQAAVHVA